MWPSRRGRLYISICPTVCRSGRETRAKDEALIRCFLSGCFRYEREKRGKEKVAFISHFVPPCAVGLFAQSCWSEILSEIKDSWPLPCSDSVLFSLSVSTQRLIFTSLVQNHKGKENKSNIPSENSTGWNEAICRIDQSAALFWFVWMQFWTIYQFDQPHNLFCDPILIFREVSSDWKDDIIVISNRNMV